MLFSSLKWVEAKDVLVPEACLFEKAHFKRLFSLLSNYSNERICNLKGVWNKNIVVLIGEQSNLPWFPGVKYFGRQREAMNVYMPTNLKCSLKNDLIQNIIVREYGKGSYLIEPETKSIVPLTAIRTIDRAFIQSFESQ